MLVLAVFTTGPALAQGGQGQGRGMMEAPKSGEGVLKGITLTADQQKKVDSIWKATEPMRMAQMEKMRAMRESGTRPDSATMAAMRAQRQVHVKEYRSLLTADQQKVFDKNLAEMRERKGGRGAGPGGPPPQ
jgi:Spy/CpxP family protein refolding chaperone